MRSRMLFMVLVLGAPAYTLELGLSGPLLVPVITAVFGKALWPSMSRLRLAALGAATVAAMVLAYGGAAFWFYGLGGPTGAWLWLGPAAALVTYVIGVSRLVPRHPWRWPLVAAFSILVMAAVGALALALGVRFES